MICDALLYMLPDDALDDGEELPKQSESGIDNAEGGSHSHGDSSICRHNRTSGCEEIMTNVRL